jgi:predicted metal-dependent enzyme (double-stranded beta helix superfamily)
MSRHQGWHWTHQAPERKLTLAAHQLRRHPPTPDALTPAQHRGSPDRYRSHALHVEPDGTFSIVALIWRPGQLTRIHDHTTRRAFAVIHGVEHEHLFDTDANVIGRNDNHVGDVSGLAPPGDIHRVDNTTEETATSIHAHGTDVTRIGTSARRSYD